MTVVSKVQLYHSDLLQAYVVVVVVVVVVVDVVVVVVVVFVAFLR